MTRTSCIKTRYFGCNNFSAGCFLLHQIQNLINFPIFLIIENQNKIVIRNIKVHIANSIYEDNCSQRLGSKNSLTRFLIWVLKNLKLFKMSDII